MLLEEWLRCERGRLTKMARFFRVTPAAVSQWAANGAPRERLLEIREFTHGEVSLEEMLSTRSDRRTDPGVSIGEAA